MKPRLLLLLLGLALVGTLLLGAFDLGDPSQLSTAQDLSSGRLPLLLRLVGGLAH
ncbi:hypothetical protein [Roseateles sp.]|jgi:hypothetical protein|uniref:hypothetical protein n=1 Tax=Roseateles sp. TaxID=1971397 RepID=UPI00391B6D10